MNNRKIRIGIIEDHPMIQRCLKNDIRNMDDCEIDFIADSFDEFKKCLKIYHPHIILLDIVLKGDKADGKDIAIYTKKYHPDIKTIVISDFFDDFLLTAMKARGVKAYLPKSMAEGRFLEKIILDVSKSDDFINVKVESSINQASIYIEGIRISSTKQQILRYLSNGYKQVEIAEIMDLQEKTIHKHLHELREKLEVKTTSELISKASRLGIL